MARYYLALSKCIDRRMRPDQVTKTLFDTLLTHIARIALPLPLLLPCPYPYYYLDLTLIITLPLP